MAEAVLEGETPGVHRLWLWHNVLVVAWQGTPNVAAVYQMAQTSEAIFSRGECRWLSYIHLVRNRIKLPGAELRAAFVETSAQFEGRMACSGVIVGGTGFWASAARGFVTGVQFLSAHTIQLRVHGQITELEPWFCKAHQDKTGVKLEPKELTRVLEQIEQREALK